MVIATLVWLQWTLIELQPQQQPARTTVQVSIHTTSILEYTCCLHALRHLLQVTLESIVSAHIKSCTSAAALTAFWEHLSYVIKYIYPAGLLQLLVSQFHTVVTVTGSATQAGTKLATAAFTAAPSGLR